MCTQVFIDSPPVVSSTGYIVGIDSLDTVADLRAYGFEVIDGVDWEPEPIDAGGIEFAPEHACLCGVDVEAVLRRSGRDFWWDPFGYTLIHRDDWTEGPNLKGSCSECRHPHHDGVCGAPHPEDPGGQVLPGCPCTA